jgi:phosphoglycolate phosphatase-like HAD superfamily hydrolase
MPIVALDIDGTMADYHGHFLRFAEAYFDQKFPDPEMINPGMPLWEHMDIPVHKYRECKLAYRQGGLKRSMPADEKAGALARNIQSMGAQVWICTTRPYLRLDNIDPDTREWLRRNGIVYNAVIFDTLEGKNTKYQELARQAGGRVVAIVDDLPESLTSALKEPGLVLSSLYLRDRPYNRHAVSSSYGGWGRVMDCEDAWKYIKRDLVLWERKS